MGTQTKRAPSTLTNQTPKPEEDLLLLLHDASLPPPHPPSRRDLRGGPRARLRLEGKELSRSERLRLRGAVLRAERDERVRRREVGGLRRRRPGDLHPLPHRGGRAILREVEEQDDRRDRRAR